MEASKSGVSTKCRVIGERNALENGRGSIPESKPEKMLIVNKSRGYLSWGGSCARQSGYGLLWLCFGRNYQPEIAPVLYALPRFG